MMGLLDVVAPAVIPSFAVIFIGYILKVSRFPGDGFWQGAESLNYFMLFPLLLYTVVARADFAAGVNFKEALSALAAALLLLVAVLFIMRAVFSRLKHDFSLIFQGSVRFNNYIGLGVVGGLLGHQGTALYALIIALVVPLSNILSVVVLASEQPDKRVTLGHVISELIKNPLIIGSALGIAAQTTGMHPAGLDGVLTILISASLGIGLLCVGAGMSFASLRGKWATMGAVIMGKLVLFPLFVFTMGAVLDLSPLARGVTVLFACLPCAASSFVLAKRYGADGELMASLTALLTIVSLPVLLTAAVIISR